jgi:hypothetical protein
VGRVIILVLSDSGDWKVKGDGAETRHARREDAVAQAKSEAKAIYDEGGLSQVRVQRTDGTWEIEYTYGNDPRDIKG